MVERQLTLEGGALYCDLGSLEPGGWQTLDCSLRLTRVLPERRVAVSVDVMEGDITRGTPPITARRPWMWCSEASAFTCLTKFPPAACGCGRTPTTWSWDSGRHCHKNIPQSIQLCGIFFG